MYGKLQDYVVYNKTSLNHYQNPSSVIFRFLYQSMKIGKKEDITTTIYMESYYTATAKSVHLHVLFQKQI